MGVFNKIYTKIWVVKDKNNNCDERFEQISVEFLSKIENYV